MDEQRHIDRGDTMSSVVAVREPFAVGAQVGGRYRLVQSLGTGGMGEVFEADDLLVGTRIALKVLRADHCGASAVERLRRELALARKITHRNVCRIHDLGDDEGRVFLTMELLRGETLADRLRRGPLPLEEARAILDQIAAGLDAAHAAGVVHRDFKSSNILLVASRAVITDFGLARSEIVGEYSQLTAEAALLGTPAYMAPEQVEGKPATAASDIYAFGVVAYEMVTGQVPFRADTPLATASLRLTCRPPRASVLRPDLPAAWDAMIARCLSRHAEHRFATLSDAVAHLETAPWVHPWAARGLAVLAVLAIVFVCGWLVGQRPVLPAAVPSFTPITHGRGTVYNARFTTDGRIVYAAAWDGEPVTTYLASPGSIEVRVLAGPGASLLSIAPDGKLALIVQPRARDMRFPFRGTLAVTSLAGGAPRPLVEDVYAADWRPDDDKPALVRLHGQHDLVEFPYGHQILDRDQGIPGFRVTHDGKHAAVSINDNARAKLVLFDTSGRSRTLVDGWRDIRGLAWSRDDRELWFTGRPVETSTNVANALYAVDLSGHVREILRTPGSLMLHDIASDGRVLLAQDDLSREAAVRGVETDDQPLSWFDDTTPLALTDDGTRMLFNEYGGAGMNGQTYQRRLDGSPPVMVSDSPGLALSPDGNLAVVYDPAHQDPPPEQLLVVPTDAAGSSYPVRPGHIQIYRNAGFSSDGHQLVTVGIESGPQATPRFYIQDLPDGEPRPVSSSDTTLQIAAQPLSPDARWVFGRDGSGGWHLFSTAGDERRDVPTMTDNDMLLRWSTDDHLYVSRKQQSSVEIAKLDPNTGVRETLFTVGPRDRAGVEMPPRVVLTPDARTCVYSYSRRLSRLYVATGLR